MAKNRSSFRLVGEKSYLTVTFMIVFSLVMLSGIIVLAINLIVINKASITTQTEILMSTDLITRLILASFGALVLVVFMAYADLVKYIQRIAGPLYRLKMCLEQYSRGEHKGPIKLRSDDEFKGLAEAINAILEEKDKS